MAYRYKILRKVSRVRGVLWPPLVYVSLLVGTASPGFGITPPSFEGCCDWSTHPHDLLVDSVGVTAFSCGPQTTVAGAECSFSGDDLDLFVTPYPFNTVSICP